MQLLPLKALVATFLICCCHNGISSGHGGRFRPWQHRVTKQFIFVPEEASWQSAETKCQEKNYTFANLQTERQFLLVSDKITNDGLAKNKYWVGLKRLHNKSIVWVNGDRLSNHMSMLFTGKNLSQLQQHLDDNIQNCFYMKRNVSFLQSGFCADPKSFLCENIVTINTTTEPPATTAKTTERTTTEKTTTEITTTKKTTTEKAATEKTTSKPPEKTTSTKSPTEKKPTSKSPPDKEPTDRPKTATDQKVDDYMKKMEKVKVEDRNSIKAAMNMTSALMSSLKKDKKAKGNVMKATKMMEDFCMKFAKMHLKPNESEIEKGDSFLIEMRRVVSKQRLSFPPKSEQTTVGRTSIELPPSLFDQDRIVVSSLYEDVTDYIPSVSDDENKKEEIVSPVISSTLDPKPEGVFEENITIILKHLKKSSKFKPSCVFWNTSVKNEMNGTWSSTGCTVNDSNENETICSCNHLTSFALLLQLDENPLTDEKHKIALSYITYIGCAFSLLGEILTVLAYVILMNMKQEQCQIRVNLAISLAIAQIFFISGITATSILGVCTFVAVMLHFFYLVAFGWMMLEGVYLYLMVVKVFNTVIKMRLYYIFAWGFPVIVVGVSLIIASTLEDGISSYTNQKFCWVSFSNGLVWSFVGPVLLVLLVNFIILVRVVREMTRLNRAKSDGEASDNIKRGVKACVVLFPLLGLTWLFGLLAVTQAGLVFQYIFTILNAFQGFFIFVLHCLRSGELQGSFKRKLQRWELTRSSNFTKSSEHSMSASDKNPLRHQFTSTDSLQDSLSRNNRVNPANTDDSNSVRTCATPIDGPPTHMTS